jgi:hypothetical protein
MQQTPTPTQTTTITTTTTTITITTTYITTITTDHFSFTLLLSPIELLIRIQALIVIMFCLTVDLKTATTVLQKV